MGWKPEGAALVAGVLIIDGITRIVEGLDLVSVVLGLAGLAVAAAILVRMFLYYRKRNAKGS